MNFTRLAIPDVIRVEPRVLGDERGFFLETYHLTRYRDGGIPEVFVQDNHSRSAPRVLRGLHAQRRHPQGKLVRCIEGEIFDVAVDLRPDSPDLGRWVGEHLSAANHHQLWVPPGFAHGFCVVHGPAQVEYKCTTFYDREDEIGVAWNDPRLAISWPIADPLLSAKDASLPSFDEVVDRLRRDRPPSFVVDRS